METKLKIQESKKKLCCPICGNTESTLFANEKLDQEKVTEFTYASRKNPEYMCMKLVECTECELVYAQTPPDQGFLSSAYASANYDSDEEAHSAARTYAKYLKKELTGMKIRNLAIDVGAGNGALLPRLQELGFADAIGVEPSRAAIAAAPEIVKRKLIEGMFTKELLSEMHPNLICSFMTLEHITEPKQFLKTAYDILEPNGRVAVVVHNRDGKLNKFLGLKSPIIDIEHLQLFNPVSAVKLLESAGFKSVKVTRLINTYSVKYWLRLCPAGQIKQSLQKLLHILYLDRIEISIPVGNIFVVGIKE